MTLSPLQRDRPVTQTIQIPEIAYREISEPEFIKYCRPKSVQSEPLFQLWEVAYVSKFGGQKIPVTVIGFEPREGGWMYHIVTPDWQGGPTRTTAPEKDLIKSDSLTSLQDKDR